LVTRLALCALIVSGCATVTVTPLREAPARSSNCPLEVFASVTKVLRPYEEVCLIEAERREGETLREVIARVSPDACRCGGNAVFPDGHAGEASVLLRVLHYTQP
jgi:hypothetical protein